MNAVFVMEFDDYRKYIDKLCTNNIEESQEALVLLKNIVIGSNRQKDAVLRLGIAPKLIALINNAETPKLLKLEALIVLGSLGKGTSQHVHTLISEFDIVDILLIQLMTPNNDIQIIEMTLCVLRSIFQYPFAPYVRLNSNCDMLSHMISLASPDSSIQIQACVTSIFVPLCQSFNEQMILCQAGTIPFLARMICSDYPVLQIPALKCLASMCFTNNSVSDAIGLSGYGGESMFEILVSLLSRIRNAEIQLASARCLTYIHRSGNLRSTDHRIVYKTLPCLARLCSDQFDSHIRATSAETLAYLTEIDSKLQRVAAISNHLILSLSQLLQSSQSLPKQGAFRCFASLGANDEHIRKRIIDMKGLMKSLIEGLGDSNFEVRLAAVRCLHSLSRSVQQLRTTFQDHSVWKPLMALLSGQPSNELLTVVTSTICNLLLEFSPAKEPMLESGVVEMLCLLTENSDGALRLNGSWALMNMAFQAEQHVKTKIINCLGTDRILKLLNDVDTRVIMKTLGLLRNLLSKTLDIDDIMQEHSKEVMQAVNMVLESSHTAEVKEQALCIIGNIAAAGQAKDYVMDNEKVLTRLGEFLVHSDKKLQSGALYALGNLVHRHDSRSNERNIKLRDLHILQKLEELLEISSKENESYDK